MRWYKNIPIWGYLAIILPMFVACQRHSVPKEYGYCRIDLDSAIYQVANLPQYPYGMEINKSCFITSIQDQSTNELYWINIVYPKLNATIHCSYKQMHDNLDELSRDAQEFVYNHAMKATKIEESEYIDKEQHVYGILYSLDGEVASPLQFYLTDSLKHFFRGAVYFNCVPNRDSLAPMSEYVQKDAIHLIETFHWQ